jgi:hypothetical protein
MPSRVPHPRGHIRAILARSDVVLPDREKSDGSVLECSTVDVRIELFSKRDHTVSDLC